IFFSVKKDIKTWKLYIHCMIEKYSLRKTAKICNISLPTAFAWRHKILDALQIMMSEVELNGIVEADETFIPLSFKGNHKNFKLPRLAKKRGTPATKRGLSREQVCVSCGINLNCLSIAKVSNLGKPKLKDLEKVLNGKIIKDSMFVTDSFRAYLKLAKDMELSHIRIPRNKYKAGTFNIQTINSYHSRLKAMITYNFKGVSTKYLNNYLVYHNFVNFAKDNKNDKEIILFDFIQENDCISKSINIANRPNIPLPDVA
ncbi:IS1595 family transposase, partial [Campylobacter coli]|nr:IS1595 family transposase [Campylobacter coli]